MGRGSNQHQALNDARSLLFGRRQVRPLSTESKRRIAADQRRLNREAAKANYEANFDQAHEELFEGNGLLLAELLREPAGHGLKGIEKKRIRELVDRFNRYGHKICLASADEVKPLNSDDDIEGAVLFYDRCQERGLADSHTWEAERAVHNYATARAHDNLINELIASADKIGPLPGVIHGGDFEDHIDRGDGTILCGKTEPFSYNPRFVDHFDHSVISEEVGCQDCLAAYQNDPSQVSKLDPGQWSSFLGKLNHDNWNLSYHRNHHLSDNGSPRQRGQELIDKLRPDMVDRVNELLAPFSDFRLS